MAQKADINKDMETTKNKNKIKTVLWVLGEIDK